MVISDLKTKVIHALVDAAVKWEMNRCNPNNGVNDFHD